MTNHANDQATVEALVKKLGYTKLVALVADVCDEIRGRWEGDNRESSDFSRGWERAAEILRGAVSNLENM